MGLVEQAPEIATCTPSDVTTFTERTALYVGTGGTLRVVPFGGGGTVDFVNVPDGTFLPIQVRQVYSTGTTCSNILLLTQEA